MPIQQARGHFPGTVAAPGLYLGTDTTTGLYQIGNGNIGLSIAGTKLLDLSSATFAVTGAGTFSTTLGVTGRFQQGSGSGGDAGVIIGNLASGFAGIWSTGVTPSNSNHSVLVGVTESAIRGTTSAAMRIGSVNVVEASSTGATVTGTLGVTGQTTLNYAGTEPLVMVGTGISSRISFTPPSGDDYVFGAGILAANDFGIYNSTDGRTDFIISGTGAVTIGGTLLSGQTACGSSATVGGIGGGGAQLSVRSNQNTSWGMEISTSVNSASGQFVSFLNASNSQQGSITATNSTTTAFNTSSDMRWKDDLGIATDLSALKNTVIHDFKWKENGFLDRGVFAQEAINANPRAITHRESDDWWGADYSKYVSDLIVGWQAHEREIQSLRAELQQLKAP